MLSRSIGDDLPSKSAVDIMIPAIPLWASEIQLSLFSSLLSLSLSLSISLFLSFSLNIYLSIYLSAGPPAGIGDTAFRFSSIRQEAARSAKSLVKNTMVQCLMRRVSCIIHELSSCSQCAERGQKRWPLSKRTLWLIDKRAEWHRRKASLASPRRLCGVI